MNEKLSSLFDNELEDIEIDELLIKSSKQKTMLLILYRSQTIETKLS